jgi:hypothetical protein
MGYVPGRQAYWDVQVEKMCKNDGGVAILERLRISRKEVEVLGTIEGKISIPIRELAHPDAPVYGTLTTTRIRTEPPYVWRTESAIMRRVDQAVLARWVSYTRSGGDFPTGLSEGTRFTCPDSRTITSDLQKLFIVE